MWNEKDDKPAGDSCFYAWIVGSVIRVIASC